MKALVVFESMFDNTEQIALAVAAGLGRLAVSTARATDPASVTIASCQIRRRRTRSSTSAPWQRLEVIRLVGEERSARSHEIRDVLHRNALPVGFYTADSTEGQGILEEVGAVGAQLPVVVLFKDVSSPTRQQRGCRGAGRHDPSGRPQL
jgi:hypothetical protein